MEIQKITSGTTIQYRAQIDRRGFQPWLAVKSQNNRLHLYAEKGEAIYVIISSPSIDR